MEQVGPVSESIVFKHFRIDPNGELHHYRRGKDRKSDTPLTSWTPRERGGMTICYIYQDDDLVGMGMAHCSLKDQFVYRIGRDIAKGRALKTKRLRLLEGCT